MKISSWPEFKRFYETIQEQDSRDEWALACILSLDTINFQRLAGETHDYI